MSLQVSSVKKTPNTSAVHLDFILYLLGKISQAWCCKINSFNTVVQAWLLGQAQGAHLSAVSVRKKKNIGFLFLIQKQKGAGWEKLCESLITCIKNASTFFFLMENWRQLNNCYPELAGSCSAEPAMTVLRPRLLMDGSTVWDCSAKSLTQCDCCTSTQQTDQKRGQEEQWNNSEI